MFISAWTIAFLIKIDQRKILVLMVEAICDLDFRSNDIRAARYKASTSNTPILAQIKLPTIINQRMDIWSRRHVYAARPESIYLFSWQLTNVDFAQVIKL